MQGIARACVALIAIASAGLVMPAHAQPIELEQDFSTHSPTQLQDRIERKHPVTYFVLAKALFSDGRKDEAAFWFYLGQIRYRAYLATHPDLEPSGDPALFSSLFEVVGRPINLYAFGDIAALVAIIDRALAWDAANVDEYAPKGAARDKVRSGLAEFKDQILLQADDMRKQRAAKGLENRTH